MIKTLVLAIAVALCNAATAASPGVDDILSANRVASGGAAWDGKATLQVEYAYAGQGLTGTTASIEDLRNGAFVDTYTIGPSGANGFDAKRAWAKEPSGTVTNQAGGDVLALAVNEAYRDQNLWWKHDRGGATIVGDGQKIDGDAQFDVLTVTPKGGKTFQAWFDARTHLLARTIEVQSTQTIATSYSDYAPTDGAQIAHTLVVDDGSGPSNRQTMTLTSARFLPAQARSTYAQPKTDLHDFSLAAGLTETTVPFELINNHVYAQVSVNGSQPLHFIFDTGGHNILTPATAKLLGVRSAGSQTATGGGENVAQSGVARVDSIRVGAATLTDQPVTVLQFDNPAEGVTEDGMIGYEFFARFVTRFDYGKHTITFIDKRHFNAKDAGTAVPIALFGQFPEVRGSYDGIAGRFGIDTGSRMGLMLTAPFAQHNNLQARMKDGVEALTGWGVGGATRGILVRGGTLRLGDVAVASPLTEISTDKGGAGAAEAFPNNVGGGILKRFVVTFDYDHERMYLKPVPGAVADLDTFDRSGMWINQQDGGFKVVDITNNGPAQQAGLRKDDLIVAVDGKPVAGMTLHDLRQRLRNEAPGTRVVFSAKRAGATQDFQVTLRDLI